MMRIAFGFVFFLLLGCASIDTTTTTEEPLATEQISGLSAQELDTGECGVFFWRNGAPRTFVFFQKQGQFSAKLFDQDIENIVKTEQDTSNLEVKLRYDFTYKGGNNETILVKAVFGDSLEGGRRILGTITTVKPDGWQEILPVIGVYVCR